MVNQNIGEFIRVLNNRLSRFVIN